MRLAALVVILAPLALSACGGDDRPIVVNTPPATASVPQTVVVPDNKPDQPVVVVPAR